MKRLLIGFTIAVSLWSCKKQTLFVQVPSSGSGIMFNNLITENDSINPIDNATVYNGGGVGIGDFNNDGLQDIYFVGNMVPNKLYINKGNFRFEDATAIAGVDGKGRWGKGASVIDINNDGLPDIYVCNSFANDPKKRQNLLYINKGLNKDGIPVFKDEAKEYGLDIQLFSTMASFFDYDNDGDLDMYLTVNEPNPAEFPNQFRPINIAGTGRSMGRLYRNDWDPKLKHPVFTDVSLAAGIKIEGYGHAATIADINLDGWKDIYVTNDFLSNNILYINNHDGTFTDKSKSYFKHTSFNAMGQDIEDINNDGLADIFELDMSPADNYRKKMMSGPSSYNTIQNFDHYGYQYQYVRNTLQLNQGPSIGENNQLGPPAFSEVGFLSGVAQTDWSWTPMVTDFDNDGYRDVIVTNGYPRDVTDHDFIAYRSNAFLITPKSEVLKQIPSVKIHNYAFRNQDGLQFKDVSLDWGLGIPSFSNGAAYADLNNDGAMDLVINNINDEALIYKNTAGEDAEKPQHYLNITFKGPNQNLEGIGTFVDIYYQHGLHQVYENNPYRGYLTSIQPIAHFGLGKCKTIDSVVVRWPNKYRQTFLNVAADQTLAANINNAGQTYTWANPGQLKAPIFTNITGKSAINYVHRDTDYADFNIQKLLPHKLSEYNPALSVGDINSDGLDDIVVGGNLKEPAQIFFQQKNGTFIQRDLLEGKKYEQPYLDGGILIFDSNGDKFPDVLITGSGYKAAANDPAYQDRLYMNDGKGHFTLAKDALPVCFKSKLCVRAFDYNNDGKLDLFISGRVEPWRYPEPVNSYILRNDTKDGRIKFTDVTNEVAPGLKKIGLICDAIFSDFDNDGKTDLILAGEWMPLTFLKNIGGKFVNVTAKSGVSNKTGWWNSIIAGDFRHTGRMDYIVGNVGLNTLYQVSDEFPAFITAGDFDKRNRFDAFPSLYLPGKDDVKREYPANVREDAVKQMITLRAKFTNYHSYAEATMQDVLSADQMKNALRLKATELKSCYFRNDGGGKFTVIPLPIEAQVSVLNGMVADDFDADGNLDLLINGNDFGTDVSIGRYDALNGLLLRGDGKGGFAPLSIAHSGIYLPGDGKALVKLKGANNNYLMAASEHLGPLRIFQLNAKVSMLKIDDTDQSAIITYKNGSHTKQEFYYGSSFLSQSSRFILINNKVAQVSIKNNSGTSRLFKF
ncbi:VCBS repeat-containing protein [Mucilaginibacter ginsenosidivorax]|uniref:RNA-binding protein n=1 Tax=Mucilaginibacter ginsenosidivorax TaxID=862126 RepID=A0A5B8WBP3_9SPHI|nr:VCBS repeat-containing protein [Mucilaginibacter ginsenosidivorax]QEC79498.1 RNA-binding protein [Mucilaginibacter ginsenosidivorax]